MLAAASTTTVVAAALFSSPWTTCLGFSTVIDCRSGDASRARSFALGVFAPPGSGYVSSYKADEDDADDACHPCASAPGLTLSDLREVSPQTLPSTYDPMLEYPGTMRPGRTPENAPYHDLPGLGIDDPDPIPWPYLQEIEWHHQWDPPHPQPMDPEDMIESFGRWASVEDEAEMRLGMRRGVRERREAEEMEGTGGSGGPLVITDDEDEEEEAGRGGTAVAAVGLDLGEGVGALLDAKGKEEEEAPAEEGEDGDVDFLLDLGLEGAGAEQGEDAAPTVATGATTSAPADDDVEDLDLALELGFDLEGEEEEEEEENSGDTAEDAAFEILDGSDRGSDMSIDDYSRSDDEGDDDAFDDGGFDYGE